MNKKVVIIGAGEIGRAVESVLQNKSEVAVELWDKNISKVPNQKPLDDIVPSADFLFLGVPSWATRDALTPILPRVSEKTIIISSAKGIEKETSKTIPELLEEVLSGKARYSLLIGPMLAEELMQGMAGIGVVASKNQEVSGKVGELFAGTNLYIEYSADIHGIALASVLKNIYAIGLGIADALELGGNFKGWLAQRMVNEMAEIVELLGGQKETAFGSAGLGDLVATGFSPYSKNRHVGDELVRTGGFSLKSEGLISLPSILERLGKNNINPVRSKATESSATPLVRTSNGVNRFPVLRALEEIILEHKDAETIFKKLASNF